MDLPAPFGKYELLERIATGGMAEVYLARSFGVAGFEKRLVIKKIRSELADDPRFVQMFINEAKIGVHLNHPNVVQVYELGRVGPAYYIAMEHLHGRDLTRLVKTLRAEGKQLPLPLSCWVVAEVCRGLAYAHGRTSSDGALLGLVHQDVSPHNVLVTFDGDVKLVDFGIARLVNTVESRRKAADEEGKQHPGGGKYAYMSPEQASGDPIDHRTDIFSAGIVLWELIVGQRLFKDSDPQEKLRKVRQAIIQRPSSAGVAIDASLWRILQRALSRDREERYPSATLFEEDMRAWLFENRHRVGRRELSDWMRGAFPEMADRSLHELSLHRMVADVERLGGRTELTVSNPTPSPRSTDTPLPGRLPVSTGERKPVCVLQIDVDGITALSARIEPEQLFVRHYQLLRWVRRVVDRFGGRIQSAQDDQITVFFGIPRTRVEDPINAIECALELQRRVPELRRKGLRLDLAMGVHFGEVTVSRGPGHRVRHVARGDTTRLARKLSAVADHGEILVSERVLELVEGAFLLVRGPFLASRGGKAPIPSLRVEGRRSTVRIASRGPWVRRHNELEVLSESLAELALGQGAAVALHGAVGTGKTRLVREIRELANRRGIPFYAARCAARNALRPMHAFAGLIRQVLGVDEVTGSGTPHQQLGRLAQLGLSPRDLEAIGTLFGLGVRHAPSRDEVWRALDRTFQGLGHEAPCIVALDDLHELDSATLADLGRLVEDTRQHPILWLLSVRHDVPSALADRVRPVILPPLDEEAQRRLVHSLLGVQSIDDALMQRVARTCEGNPLYVEEMLKYLLEQDRIELSEGHARLVESDEAAELPSTLATLLGARLDELDAGEKGMLQLAAIVGPAFPEDLLAEAAGLEDPTPMLAELATHGLIQRTRSDHWVFASDLIHRAALHGILAVQRGDYHRMVATAIESIHHDELGPWHEALVRHCGQSDRPIDAARYAFLAGQNHEQRQLLERARELYRSGIEAITHSPKSADNFDARVQGEATLNLHLGRMSHALGELEAGQRSLQLALDISADAGLPWIEVHAHVELGRLYLELGRHVLAKAHVTQARALLRIEDDPILEQQALETAAALAFEMGRNDEAERLWREALTHAAEDPAAAARCEIGLANRMLRVGRHEEAQPLLEGALLAARALGDRILEGRVLNNIGLLHSWAGRHVQALSYYRQALEVREGIGYVRGVVVNHHNVGDTHFQLGDWAKAYVAFQRSQELAAEMGWDRGVLLNEVYMAYISASQGQDPFDRILKATEDARTLGDAEITTAGGWLAGRHLAETGRDEEARAQLASALADAERWELASMVAMIRQTIDGLEG